MYANAQKCGGPEATIAACRERRDRFFRLRRTRRMFNLIRRDLK
jgi:hypothetical protein